MVSCDAMAALIPVCAELNSKGRQKQDFVGMIYACFPTNASVCEEKLSVFRLYYLLYNLSYVISNIRNSKDTDGSIR
jgi:hypothetical protein